MQCCGVFCLFPPQSLVHCRYSLTTRVVHRNSKKWDWWVCGFTFTLKGYLLLYEICISEISDEKKWSLPFSYIHKQTLHFPFYQVETAFFFKNAILRSELYSESVARRFWLRKRLLKCMEAEFQTAVESRESIYECSIYAHFNKGKRLMTSA